MPEFITNAVPGAIIALVIGILGVVAYRRFNTKQLGEIQERLIEAQEKEIKRLRREVAAMRAALKHLGIEIEIDGNEVILIDEQKPKRTRIMTVSIEDNVKNGTTKEG